VLHYAKGMLCSQQPHSEEHPHNTESQISTSPLLASINPAASAHTPHSELLTVKSSERLICTMTTATAVCPASTIGYYSCWRWCPTCP
jgi:hypothetical protein